MASVLIVDSRPNARCVIPAHATERRLLSYYCTDFIAEYQVLVRADTPTTSRFTVNAMVGVDSRGVPLGTITDPSVLNAMSEKLKAVLLQGLP